MVVTAVHMSGGHGRQHHKFTIHNVAEKLVALRAHVARRCIGQHITHKVGLPDELIIPLCRRLLLGLEGSNELGALVDNRVEAAAQVGRRLTSLVRAQRRDQRRHP
jgi:hypothetical protein